MSSGDETHTCRNHACDPGDAESADSIIRKDSSGDELIPQQLRVAPGDCWHVQMLQESDPRVGGKELQETALALPVGTGLRGGLLVQAPLSVPDAFLKSASV